MKKTIIDLFEDSVGKYGGKTFLLEKRHHRFEPTTYAETRELALEVGAGLAASGIRPGDKVAILAEGSNAWIISELGLFYAGAVSVPLSVKLEESNDLLFRLRKMQELGADIPKIAVMPRCPGDVIALLDATQEMSGKYADRPIITMSMGAGVVSRLCGEYFGSAMTFGAVGQVSAPGQIPVEELNAAMDILPGPPELRGRGINEPSSHRPHGTAVPAGQPGGPQHLPRDAQRGLRSAGSGLYLPGL